MIPPLFEQNEQAADEPVTELPGMTSPIPADMPTTPVVSSGSPVLATLINICAVLILVTIQIMVYHNFFVVPAIPPRIAALDVNEVLEVKQLQETMLLLKGGMSEQNAMVIYNDIANFARSMDTEVRKLQEECKCVLVVRAAVMTGARVDDLTPLIKERLGMAGLEKDNMLRELEASGLRQPPQPGFFPNTPLPSQPSFPLQQPAVPPFLFPGR